MGCKDVLDREETIAFVLSCWDEEAGTFLIDDDELTTRMNAAI